MIIYIFLFLICLLWFFVGEKSFRSTKILALFILGLCLFVGLTDMLGGYDRYIYAELFDNLADIRNSEGNIAMAYIFQAYPKELGYDFLNVLISFVTSNRYIFILTITIIVYVFIFLNLKEYTENYPFALLLFLGLFFFFTFTYLRQVLGVTIAWFAIRYAVKQKIWKYLFVLLIAVLMHNSAIIFFPVYFLGKKKFKPTTVYLLLGLCLLVGLTGLPTTLFEIYGETAGMEERAVGYVEDTGGFRIEYVLESFVFLYFVMKYYTRIPYEKRYTVLLNMALIFCGILLIFVRSLNGGRLAWYYMIGVISTLTYIAAKVRCPRYYRPAIIALSFVLYMRIVVQWGVLLSPYKTFFTEGHRPGDRIYELYEYDYNYDKDKFYR